MSRILLSLVVVVLIGCTTEKPATKERRPHEHATPPLASVRVERLDGSLFDPLAQPEDVKARVFVFLTTDCPIANRYAPTLQRLAKRCLQEDVAFTLVYPNETDTADDIRQHQQQYQHNCAAVRDVSHSLVAITGVTVTPEVAVFDTNGTMVYRGRIDDWYVDFGKNRPAPTTHDLRDAIDAIVEGAPVREPRTKAIGCYIHDKADSPESRR